jgi:hypothetical protein
LHRRTASVGGLYGIPEEPRGSERGQLATAILCGVVSGSGFHEDGGDDGTGTGTEKAECEDHVNAHEVCQ